MKEKEVMIHLHLFCPSDNLQGKLQKTDISQPFALRKISAVLWPLVIALEFRNNNIVFPFLGKPLQNCLTRFSALAALHDVSIFIGNFQVLYSETTQEIFQLLCSLRLIPC